MTADTISLESLTWQDLDLDSTIGVGFGAGVSLSRCGVCRFEDGARQWVQSAEAKGSPVPSVCLVSGRSQQISPSYRPSLHELAL